MSSINLQAILIANIIGALLIIGLLVVNRWRLKDRDSESKIIYTMALSVLVSCVLDPICFYCDGKQGFWPAFGLYSCNAIQDIVGMIVATCWVRLIYVHIVGYEPHWQEMLAVAGVLICIVLLLINGFVPLVFTIDDNNVYSRGPGLTVIFSLYVAFLLNGVIVYIVLKKESGVLKCFPIFHFILPITIGIIIQAFWYGVSTCWCFIAASLTAVMASFQNEYIFKDKLTGLYNRFYLDNLKSKIIKSKNGTFTIMMLDLNGFKKINDAYGHNTGDIALKETASILEQAVGSIGNVIRYAGDEFIVVLNTHNNSFDTAEWINKLKREFNTYNENHNNPYQLSISIGSCQMNLKEKTVDEVINEVDSLMYVDKDNYYNNKRSCES